MRGEEEEREEGGGRAHIPVLINLWVSVISSR